MSADCTNRTGDKAGRGVPTVRPVAQAIETLHSALADRYGSDFAYTVLGNGHTLGAANLKDGLIVPTADGHDSAKPLPKSIVIIGRRWFGRGPGKTYHSAEVIVDGVHWGKVPYSYGYGDQYLESAAELLTSAGMIPPVDHSKHEPLWYRCQSLGIAFTYSVSDVSRKKDL